MTESRQVDISDSDDESMCDSLSSIVSDHEHNPYDDLLDCFGLKSASHQTFDGIEFDSEEERLLEFLQSTKSLPIIQKVLQQNHELAKKLSEKIYPEEQDDSSDEEDEVCPKCKK